MLSVPAAKIIPHPALGAVPTAAQIDGSGHLDAEAATRAYLDTVPADKRLASNKYFEGGYWLKLWDAVYTIAFVLVLLFSGLSARMRDFAAARSRHPWLQTGLFFVLFTLLITVVEAPLTWYESF